MIHLQRVSRRKCTERNRSYNDMSFDLFHAFFGRHQNWIETPTLTNFVSCHTEAVISVAWSLDGKAVSSVCQTGAVRVWDTLTGRLLHEGASPINSDEPRLSALRVALSPDGCSGAYASEGSIFIWDTLSGCTKSRIYGDGYQTSIAFH